MDQYYKFTLLDDRPYLSLLAIEKNVALTV